MYLNRPFPVPFQTPNPAPPIAPLPQNSTSWLSAERASSTYITDRFGIRLRTLRKARGMTQLEMSIEFGIDRSFISDVCPCLIFSQTCSHPLPWPSDRSWPVPEPRHAFCLCTT
jgi:hypothetical protein